MAWIDLSWAARSSLVTSTISLSSSSTIFLIWCNSVRGGGAPLSLDFLQWLLLYQQFFMASACLERSDFEASVVNQVKIKLTWLQWGERWELPLARCKKARKSAWGVRSNLDHRFCPSTAVESLLCEQKRPTPQRGPPVRPLLPMWQGHRPNVRWGKGRCLYPRNSRTACGAHMPSGKPVSLLKSKFFNHCQFLINSGTKALTVGHHVKLSSKECEQSFHVVSPQNFFKHRFQDCQFFWFEVKLKKLEQYKSTIE